MRIRLEPCPHCGVERRIEVDGRGRLRFACPRCGCVWGGGFRLLRRGAACPAREEGDPTRPAPRGTP